MPHFSGTTIEGLLLLSGRSGFAEQAGDSGFFSVDIGDV
jgi:hypothetical protein